MVYSTGTINTNQVCQAKNSIQTRQINSGDTITVEPGCYIRTMDHVISADESETFEIQRKTMDWAGKLQSQHRRHPQGDPRTPDQVQRRIRRQRAVQRTRPDQTSGGTLDIHLTRCHDRHRPGSLPDRHAEHML